MERRTRTAGCPIRLTAFGHEARNSDRLVSFSIVVLLSLSAACGERAPLDVASISAKVYAMSNGKDPAQLGLTVGWAGGEPSEQQTVGAYARIERTFQTLAAAQQWKGTFVAKLQGGEVGREPAHLGLCDAVSKLGFDPSKRSAVVVRREVYFDAGVPPRLSKELHFSHTPHLSCLLGPIPDGVPARRELRLRLPLDEQPVKFALNGAPLEPADIAYWRTGSQSMLYLLRLEYPYSKPIQSIRDELAVTTGGQTYKLFIKFAACRPGEVAVEQRNLQISNGKLELDYRAGLTCTFTDGTGFWQSG